MKVELLLRMIVVPDEDGELYRDAEDLRVGPFNWGMEEDRGTAFLISAELTPEQFAQIPANRIVEVIET